MPHYKKCHPDREVFVSRISVEMAERAKNESRFIIRYNKPSSFDAFCYFCEEFHRKNSIHWCDHIRSLTGEYAYECLICGKEFAFIRLCCEQKLNKKIVFDLCYNDLTAFICQMCNYVKISEENIHKHLKIEHELDNIDGQYKKIILLTSLKNPKNQKRN